MKVLLIRDLQSSLKTASRLNGVEVVIKPLFNLEYVNLRREHVTYDYAIITSKKAKPCLKYFKFKQLIEINSQFKNAKAISNYIKNLNGSILYLRGEEISYNFRETLPSIKEIVCYKLNESEVVTAANEFDVVMLYSKNFSKKFINSIIGDISKKTAICISDEVASVVKEKMNTIVALEPNEDAMIGALCAIR